MKGPPRQSKLWLIIIISMVCILSSTSLGSSGFVLPWYGEQAKTIWFDLRLPRAATAVLVGALLAIAGLVMQNTVRNPLADPYLFGSAAGAALAVLLLLIFLPDARAAEQANTWLAQLSVTSAAFIGSLLTLLVLVGLASGGPGNRLSGNLSSHLSNDTSRLVLIGVALASTLGAILQLLTIWANEPALRGIYFWMMGAVPDHYPSAWLLLLTATVFIWVWLERKTLDAVVHGAALARNFGVDYRKAMPRLLALASLATALAVSQAGAIAFVGLAAPHIARRVCGDRAQLLIPASMCIGALIVTLADAIGRSVLAPQTIPVGVLTTFIGTPILFHLLSGRKVSRSPL